MFLDDNNQKNTEELKSKGEKFENDDVNEITQCQVIFFN